ncbi:glycosyltransferase family 22 protein [Polychaeton citri CBS 116435]|uniref:Mannosyltransferase n=1 Tax=Polychaeton citri CBS 116435 TaxID=1314669 RepID=A0A9P4QBB6_9PEZI|nr:glycosyltransferase family 22 protein [Polychaeton citri CBS 116435]
MSKVIDYTIDLMIPAVILLHLFCSPYTKVEESFNIQATHDIIEYGIPLRNPSEAISANFDHVSFPGSVPRTFVGALALATVCKVLNAFCNLVDTGFRHQVFIRGVLGLANAGALLGVRRAIDTAFGKTAGRYFVFLQASTFHVMYYASRTLPNMFAMVLTSLALRNLILVNSMTTKSVKSAKRRRFTLYLLTAAGVIFRSEIAILLGFEALVLLKQRASLFNEIIPAGILGAAIGLATTVSVDSFFWQRFPLWPELVGFYYNTILGKSAEWGTSPFHFYFVNALPRLLLNPVTYLVCIPMAMSVTNYNVTSQNILLPHLGFIAVYSLLPHKEWRFIVYSVPAFLAIASAGASWIWTRRTKKVLYSVLTLALIASIAASFAASLGLLYISSLNYPGGEALQRLHELRIGHEKASVHMDDLACQTGITRFLQTQPLWTYDKTENQTQLHEPMFWQQFDFALAEHPETVIGSWRVIDTIQAFAGLKLRAEGEENALPLTAARGSLLHRAQIGYNSLALLVRSRFTMGYWPTVRMQPKLYILEKEPPSIYVHT